MSIEKYSDTELLHELIRRNPASQGPHKTVYDSTIRETIIGIGDDNIATILLHQDDLDVLARINVKEQIEE